MNVAGRSPAAGVASDGVPRSSATGMVVREGDGQPNEIVLYGGTKALMTTNSGAN